MMLEGKVRWSQKLSNIITMNLDKTSRLSIQELLGKTETDENQLHDTGNTRRAPMLGLVT